MPIGPQQQVPVKVLDLRKMLQERKETVKLCVEYLHEVCALEFPLAKQHMNLENMAQREGIREACLVLNLAIVEPKPKAGLIMPNKKIKI